MRSSVVTAAIALALLAATPAASKAPTRWHGRPVGIDVSRFNGLIKWKRVARSGIRFAFVQASRGSGGDCTVAPDRCGPDEHYVANYLGARANRIRVGAYHRAFASGRTLSGARRDARREARVFLAAVEPLKKRDLRPVLDVETPFRNLNARRLRTWVHIWLREVEDGLGVKPIIYTNATSWSATGDTDRFALEGYPLWVANWHVRAPAVPAGDWAGLGWSVWQHTSTGHVRGIAGNVDRNRLDVPLSRLRADSE